MNDFYRNEENVYNRLVDEFKRYGKLIICCDFDDTIYDFHKVGRRYDQVIELLRRWENYSELIIFTGNGPEEYPMIEEYLNKLNIKYKGINCDSSVKVKGRKVYANVYIDDRGGLPLIYEIMERIITEIESGVIKRDFNPIIVKNQIVDWIRNFFKENGPVSNAVVGISGGIDSSTIAALCVDALGKDKVLGVLMPNGPQHDIDCSISLCKHLDINHTIINIKDSVDGILNSIDNPSNQTKINLPARIRMSTLYAFSQSNNGRVANTCNASETYVGYDTRYGDSVGDFSPLANLTKTEVREIATVLGLPDFLINKPSEDGLSGKTDEDAFGFTYEVLDKYIRTGICEDKKIKSKIDTMHERNKFKTEPMPKFELK